MVATRGSWSLSAQALSDLMGGIESSVERWSGPDLRAILEHQLCVPVATEIERLASAAARPVDQVRTDVDEVGARLFGDLLFRGSSATLGALKAWAKAGMEEPDGLPGETLRVLYVAAVGRARRMGGGGISSMSDRTLQREARRCLTLSWLPESLRSVLRDVDVVLGSEGR